MELKTGKFISNDEVLVTCKTYSSDFVANEYFLGDKQVSRKDAFIHVMKNRGWNQVAIDCFDWDSYGSDW